MRQPIDRPENVLDSGMDTNTGDDLWDGLFSLLDHMEGNADLAQGVPGEYQNILDAVPAPLLIHDHDFSLVGANHAYARAAGMPVAESLGRPYWEVFPRIRGSLPWHENSPGNPRQQHADLELGPGIIYRALSFPVHDEHGQDRYMLHVLEDVSSDRISSNNCLRLGKKLMKQWGRAQAIIDKSRACIVVLDGNGSLQLINRRLSGILGYRRSEMLGRSWFGEFVQKDQDSDQDDHIQALLQGGTAQVTSFMHAIASRHGIEQIMSWHYSLLQDKHGKTTGIVGNGRDLTRYAALRSALGHAIKQLVNGTRQHEISSDQLQDGQDKLRVILHDVSEGIVIADRSGRIKSANRSMERLLRSDEGKLAGRDLHSLVQADTGARTNESLADLLRHADDGIAFTQSGFACVRSDGSVFPVTLAITSCKRIDEHFYLIVVHDPGEAAQAGIREPGDDAGLATDASRLECAGEVAAVIAHELNQPLSAIQSYGRTASLMADHLDGEYDDLKRTIHQALIQSDRANEIVRKLSAFLRKDAGKIEDVDLADVVNECTGLASEMLEKNGIATRTEIDDEARWIAADRIQVGQILSNLLRNSADALSGEGAACGEIIISARPVSAGMVQVTVQDSGPGVDRNIMDRIFNPFYTTRAEGMGIGLKVCQQLVEAQGGRIWAESGPGGRFHFTLRRGGHDE